MSIVDSLSLIFVSFAMGISLFAATLFVGRADHPKVHYPLALFFFANALTYPSSIGELLGLQDHLLAGMEASEAIPFYLLMPALWFYVKALTAEKTTEYGRQYYWHLTFFGLAVILAILIWTVTPDVRVRLWDGPIVHTLYEAVIALFMNVVFLAQPIFTIAYAVAITRKLVRYRARLKDMFASTEQREMRWISWLVSLFAVDQVATFASDISILVTDVDFYDSPISDALGLALFWTLALWGARQKPGLLENEAEMNIGKSNTEAQDSVRPGESNKYGRSALTDEMRSEIATKIQQAMDVDTLYLESNLSLNKLAAHIGVHANYVSQVINTTLESSFFDYVNGKRIETAAPRVKSEQETILAIAFDVGFNTRSSFYTAFKKHRGMTPTEYRRKEETGSF
ncbi:MAG: helix-turn-helix transcriptional regulator [Alphaproteobacteria bacterium]|nr:helix-turn-helix transcriptional regulator [Alphaproteobacteria bacterium]